MDKTTSGHSVACCGSCVSFLVDNFYKEILLMAIITELDWAELEGALVKISSLSLCAV